LLIGLHIFVSVIQAYIFTVLPAIYLGLATADEH
jgi:F0F1-type ATP synthase membrane subunit a